MHLIRAAERDHNGIAMYYDQTAVHAATAYSHPSNVIRFCQSFEKVIEDLGYQYDYVTPHQITHDHLSEEAFRILILPHTLAMDADTASGIRAFAANGGVVLADTPPARYDENLDSLGETSGLAPLFGEPGQPKMVGKGMGLLLDNGMQEYWRSRTRGGGPAVRTAFRELLTQHAIPPEATISSTDNTGHVGLETIVYRAADARYIGVINRGSAVREALELKTPGVVYDLRERRCLGQTGNIALELASGDVAFFAVYPAALPDARLKPVSEGTLGTSVVFPGVLEDAVQTRRVLRLTVRQPDGRERSEYAKVLEAVTGVPCQFDLPLALNDPVGEWRVEATDVITGKKQSMTLDVAPR